MSSFTTTAGYAGPTASIIYRSRGGIAGLREVFDKASKVAVYAFPFRLCKHAAVVLSLKVPACYILSNGERCYIGETKDAADRLLQHLRDDGKSFADMAFVIRGSDPTIVDKNDAIYFQHHLMRYIEAAGVVDVTNRADPYKPNLSPSDEAHLIRMLEDVRRLLFDAGFKGIVSAGEIARGTPALTLVSSSETDAPPMQHANDDNEDKVDDADAGDDGVLIENGISELLRGAVEYEFTYSDYWARGYECQRGFVVMPGSDVSKTVNPSANPIEMDRHLDLHSKGALEKLPHSKDKLRLVRPLLFLSKASAARVVGGGHISGVHWKPVHAPVIVMEPAGRHRSLMRHLGLTPR
jgi:hypothetical protein